MLPMLNRYPTNAPCVK